MFKYILIIQIFLNGLFAHSDNKSHLHFFSTLHVDSFVLFLVAIILGFGLFKHFSKETN